MSRDDLKSKAEPGGFVEYGKEQLPKVDSMRRDKSQPDFFGVPILHDADVLFSTASETGEKPASCYTCQKQQSDGTCFLLGPEVKVEKVTGHRDSGDPIEYWPCCSAHQFGDPNSGAPAYSKELSSPDSLGLIWINAPEVGQKLGGANCGGVNGGDDCDHFIVKEGEKWENESGFCRVLQHEVAAGDVCAAWRDDDELSWQEAQQLMQGESLETVDKKKLAKDIIGRDDQ
jgi:hypothetical protein